MVRCNNSEELAKAVSCPLQASAHGSIDRQKYFENISIHLARTG